MLRLSKLIKSQLSSLLVLSPLIFFICCGCKDERVSELESRVTRLETKLSNIEKSLQEKPAPTAAPTAAPTVAPTATPDAAKNLDPVTDATYYITGDEKDDPFIGQKDGKILMMAFFDYESQASRRFANVTLPELKKES